MRHNMIRIFKVGTGSWNRWPGRCTVDSNDEDSYIYHRDWPILSKYQSTFTTSLDMLLSAHCWEEVDPDLAVAEGL